ncbi:MAG: hypothetical protein ABL925_02020 [Methylococcales bacterium]
MIGKTILGQGFTLLETLITLIFASFLMLAISSMVNTALNSKRYAQNQNVNLQQARFAMQRLVYAVRHSKQMLVPLTDDSSTAWSESVRNVLAVSLEPTLDNNNDGWADANNDRDFLDLNNNGSRDTAEPERIDEDLDNDNNNDSSSGIIGIDDNGDGQIDGKNVTDNDEDGNDLEDTVNNIDDDGDLSIDEDTSKDMNGDGKSGISGVDDDFDGRIDEDQDDDDDEDGAVSEDWLDPHVFFLNGTLLMERLPNLLPATGKDYSEFAIAENVSQFRIEKIVANNAADVLVDISLTITPTQGNPISLTSRVILGSGL